MARIHLIESSKDRDLAERFEQALKRNHSVSSDISFLVPGQEWRRSLREAVLAADGLVAIFTANSVREDSNIISSQWMAADIGAARALGKFVIPVIVGDNVRFPALIDDIFVVQTASADAANITNAVNQVEDAIQVNTERREKERALSLPVGYEHLASSVLRFHADGPYNQSVFVMMKFPDPTALKPNQFRLLEDIWDVLVRTLTAYGLTPRRADKRDYHEQLWENICVYMLGSRYGIAILEDRVAEEMNPNVTLEYGFMKSLNRQVALLRDVQFRHDRADLTGKLSKPFEIDNDGKLNAESLARAVREWLLDLGVPPIRRA